MNDIPNVRNYLIDHSGLDWAHLLSEWAHELPDRLTVWLMNRFGDLFLAFPDGSIHILDLGGDTLRKLAENREDFCNKIDEDDNVDDWLMIPLVNNLVNAGMCLHAGQCYSFKLPPILGGDYAMANAFVLGIVEHFAFYGDVHRQLRDVPDGAKVILEVKD